MFIVQIWLTQKPMTNFGQWFLCEVAGNRTATGGSPTIYADAAEALDAIMRSVDTDSDFFMEVVKV